MDQRSCGTYLNIAKMVMLLMLQKLSIRIKQKIIKQRRMHKMIRKNL
jgi:hypothetical protein